ncbi:hypothetical protein [Paenibacillus sp. EPM92]|uniref:hypothetical protein n=1 Tax=Paenibacillus sp. EPM92 TaxID=1561195 RepID=UPI001916880A|nr:hypothetical protein [Paenibacillus sp. EPM92]
MREELVACEDCGVTEVIKNKFTFGRTLCEVCEYEQLEAQEFYDELMCNYRNDEDAGEAWDSFDID